MLYLPSIVLIVVGLAVLAVVSVRAIRVLRRFRRTANMVATDAGDRAGLLRARSAALRIAIEARRHDPAT